MAASPATRRRNAGEILVILIRRHEVIRPTRVYGCWAAAAVGVRRRSGRSDRISLYARWMSCITRLNDCHGIDDFGSACHDTSAAKSFISRRAAQSGSCLIHSFRHPDRTTFLKHLSASFGRPRTAYRQPTLYNTAESFPSRARARAAQANAVLRRPILARQPAPRYRARTSPGFKASCCLAIWSACSQARMPDC